MRASRKLQSMFTLAGLLVVGAMFCVLTVDLLSQAFRARSADTGSSAVELPQYSNDLWNSVAVREGRVKPFQTVCIESVRFITGRDRFQGHDPTGLVLAWWLGNDGEASINWETCQFIYCDHPELRDAIRPEPKSVPVGGALVSPAELRQSPAFDQLLKAVARKRKDSVEREKIELTALERKAEEVSRRLVLFDALRGQLHTRLARNAIVQETYVDIAEAIDIDGGTAERAVEAAIQRAASSVDRLKVVRFGRSSPAISYSLSEIKIIQRDPERWYRQVAERRRANGSKVAGPREEYSKSELEGVLSAWSRLRSAYASGHNERFVAATNDFLSVAAGGGQNHDSDEWTIPLEVALNSWRPFRWAWVSMLAAFAMLILGIVRPPAYRVGMVLYAGAFIFQTIAIAMRMVIAGRAPVSNMYESVVFAAYVIAGLGLALEWTFQRKGMAASAAALSTFGLLLADQLPISLDPSINPLVPALRSNYWLTVHVLTITGSYAAGTLAWGLGNLALAVRMVGSTNSSLFKSLSLAIERTLRAAVLLLAAGTFLGAWWASEAWGRFWGWDPKEVAALIALVCYVIPLHARYLGWLNDFGLAIAAVICFASIVVSWYFVNFLVASGLHSYGFAAGGSGWVLWAALLNVIWVLASLLVEQ
jgi:ABC-type transport system involved in cytochrome c biogenesis permease subunit